MLAQDLITRAPVTLEPGGKLSDAARRMREADVGSVVVVDRGGPVGVLTDRDAALALASGVEDLLVTDVMTPFPVMIPATADVEQCLDRMESHGVRRILIMEDDERLVGVVSLDDVLMHLGYLMGKAAALVRTEVSSVQQPR